MLLVCGSLQAQTPVFRLREAKGLWNVQMTVAFQDSRGWMWFGAENGLYRYDGLTYYAVGLPDSLPPAPVSAMYEWNGSIWVGFQNGMIGTMPVNSTFPTDASTTKGKGVARLQLWQPEEGLPTKAVTGFAADRIGGFWISTYGEGIYCLKDNRLYQFNSTDDHLAGDDIYSIACDAKNRIWAGTDGGINICSMPEKGKKQVLRLSTGDGLPDEIITSLLADKHGNIWIGTYEKGICHYNVAEQKIDVQSSGWSYGIVTGMAVFGSGELWAGTATNGLVHLDVYSGEILPLPESHPLRHSKLLSVCKDREGLLWSVCDKGLVYSANVRFGMLATPFSNVQAVLVDRRHRLWAGSKGGLYLQENSVFRQVLPTDRNVISLWESPADGSIWAGTFGDGVYMLDASGKVTGHLTEQNGLSNGSVLSIDGNAGQVWLASLGGVTVKNARNPGQPDSYSDQSELGTSYVYKVFRDHLGRIWFGTDGKGLIVLENGAFRHFEEANGAPLKTIYSITEDIKGNIWFSTDKDGLFCYDGRRFRRYTTENHLHSLAISGLSADAGGRILIAYEDGVDILDPNRVDHVTFCNAAIGAPATEINLNALCHDAKGNTWLGTRQGILRVASFDEPFLDDPQPGITAIAVLAQSIDFLTNRVFSHDENYFIFNFTGLWYTDPESVRYRYKLEGFDPDWKISKDHLTSYPSLPPGQYTFRVQTSEHGNFENVPEATWAFSIRKPFWTNWWFIAFGLCAVGALIYALIRSRESRLEREAQLKREKVESQFAVLKSQINPHFLFNSFNTLITIIEENPKVAVEYVEHLSDFYRSIIAYREKDFISLQEEVALVHSFDFLLKKRYEDGFHLIDRLNGQTGLVMPLALQLLVENAVKHNVISSSRPLTVEIFTDDNGYVVVRNNIQPKIKPEPSTHFGLQSLVHRYRLLGERPVIVEDNAAFFTVKVPLIHSKTTFLS
ncbi:MAG: histidine kinase [Saprospiraceae bacterium]|nr:histidine kinase [Saprospiraceae bacterium]